MFRVFVNFVVFSSREDLETQKRKKESLDRERESDDDGEESAAATSAEEEEDERRNAVSFTLFFVSQSDLSLLSSRKSD